MPSHRTRRSTTRPSIARPENSRRCPRGYKWNNRTQLCDPMSPVVSPVSTGPTTRSRTRRQTRVSPPQEPPVVPPREPPVVPRPRRRRPRRTARNYCPGINPEDNFSLESGRCVPKGFYREFILSGYIFRPENTFAVLKFYYENDPESEWFHKIIQNICNIIYHRMSPIDYDFFPHLRDYALATIRLIQADPVLGRLNLEQYCPIDTVANVNAPTGEYRASPPSPNAPEAELLPNPILPEMHRSGYIYHPDDLVNLENSNISVEEAESLHNGALRAVQFVPGVTSVFLPNRTTRPGVRI